MKKMAALRKSRHCQRLSALEELQLALDAVVLVGVVRVGLAARNGGPFAGELGVERDEFLLILRDVLFGEDGSFRAFGFLKWDFVYLLCANVTLIQST